MGRPLPPVGAAGMSDLSSRPRYCRASSTAHRAPDRRAAGHPSVGPARIGSTSGWTLDGPQGPDSLPVPPLTWTDPATRTRIKRVDRTPLRVPAARRADPRGHQELGRIPTGGGWKKRGRTIGNRHNKAQRPGYAYLHHAVDDHSRLVYSEIPRDERKETACGFWRRAVRFFAAHGITVRR